MNICARILFLIALAWPAAAFAAAESKSAGPLDSADLAAAEPSVVALACPSGWVPCGNEHCIPAGAVCCASVGREDLYCQSGQTCTSDGRCQNGGGGGGGGGGECGAGFTLTQATCGGDSCSCALACDSSSDCATGCCSGGYCALSCVCNGQGSVDYSCGDGGGGFGGGGGCAVAAPSSGAGAAPSASPGLALLIPALLVGLVVAGRRRARAARRIATAGVLLLGLAAGARTAAAQATGCTMDSQCKGDRICDEGVCRAPTAAACVADTDCPGDAVCESGTCAVAAPAPAPAPVAEPPARRPYAPPHRTAAATPPPVPPPAAAPADSSEAATPDGDDPRRMRRKGVALDGQLTLGVARFAEEGFMTLGQSSAIGAYVNDRFAVMLSSSYDDMMTESELSMYTVGFAVRESNKFSNNSYRTGLSYAYIGDGFGNGMSGLGLSGHFMLMGRGHAGISLDIIYAAFGEDVELFRVGVSGAFMR